jgi:hypothetical protein
VKSGDSNVVKFRSFAGVSALSLALMAASADRARADFSLSINVGNPSPGVGQYAGPYASVQFTQTGANTLHVVITAQNNGSQYFLFRTVGLNLSAGVSFVNGSLNSSTGLGTITPTFGVGNSGNLDGFGDFNHFIDAGSGASAGLTSLSFDLTGIAVVGTGSNFLTPNPDGFLIAMHINAYGNASYTGGALTTGFGANGGTGPGPNVPAPPTAILAAAGGLSFGLSGLFGWKRRRLAIA